MQHLNTSFTRALLAQVTPDVLKLRVKLSDGWVYRLGRDHYEFHYHAFYWHGRASDKYEARYNGWCAYLASVGTPGYTKETS